MTDQTPNNRPDPTRDQNRQGHEQAHTHGEPDTRRLAEGGAHPEQQPRNRQGGNPDEAMAGDHGQTRQPQGHGTVQPDGGVNSGNAPRGT